VCQSIIPIFQVNTYRCYRELSYSLHLGVKFFPQEPPKSLQRSPRQPLSMQIPKNPFELQLVTDNRISIHLDARDASRWRVRCQSCTDTWETVDKR